MADRAAAAPADVCAIRALLPHSPPALLIDRVLELDPHRRILATKAVTLAEPCYRGLPRDAPASAYAYPESLLLESFGQAAALLWLLSERGAVAEASVLMLVSARECRIEARARPGDILRHDARLEHVVGDNVFVSGETYVADSRIASVGSMMAVLRPRAEVLPDAAGAATPLNHPSGGEVGDDRDDNRQV
ncbi:MAG: 3-hydroxyacyl-ACP dehydratase FabZ family protein [Solirubrobacteraceae bacterium]